MRIEAHRGAFTEKLGRIVSALGTIPDSASGELTTADMARLRELVDETVDAIERRIEVGADDQQVQQHLAGTVYEIRRRMEIVGVWFEHQENN